MYYKFMGTKIYYEKHGSGKRCILILPGWGNTRNTFYNIINNFKDKFSIYILDYPGFGNSPVVPQELTIYDYALMVRSFIKYMRIDNPILLAHSFGGRIAAVLIGKYKIGIDKLILIDVAGIKRKKSLKVFIREKIYKSLNFITFNKYRSILDKVFASTDYNNIPNCMKKTFKNIVNEDLRSYYKLINSDTLIIWGSNDRDTPLKDGKYLKKVIKNSELIVYKNKGHFSYLENMSLTNSIIYYMLI